MSERDKNRENKFDDERVKRDADYADEPYNRDDKDIEGKYQPRKNNPHTMTQSTMPARGSNTPDDMGSREHYFLNLNFDKKVVEDENKLLDRYQKIIDAMDDVSDRHGRQTNDREYEALVKKIDDAVNNNDSTLDVTENQIEYLSMSLRYIKDQTVKEKLENAIERARKEQMGKTRTTGSKDEDMRKAGTRENDIRINPEVKPEDEERRREGREGDEGPIV